MDPKTVNNMNSCFCTTLACSIPSSSSSCSLITMLEAWSSSALLFWCLSAAVLVCCMFVRPSRLLLVQLQDPTVYILLSLLFLLPNQSPRFLVLIPRSDIAHLTYTDYVFVHLVS